MDWFTDFGVHAIFGTTHRQRRVRKHRGLAFRRSAIHKSDPKMPFRTVNQSATIAIGITSVVAAAAMSWEVYKRRLCHADSSSASSWGSFRHNRHATGSQVVALYKSQINEKLEGQMGTHENKSVYVVTGASRGLGLQTARLLSTIPNVHIVLGCRDVEAGCIVANDINSGPDSISKAECCALDLSSFSSVRSFANRTISVCDKLGANKTKIRGLINNAGTYALPGTTMDGFQITFQTNTLSHALLTELLLPRMAADARIVNVSSEMMGMVWNRTRVPHRLFPPIDGGGTEWDYALSKACQGLHAHELNIRFGAGNSSNRRAFAIEPGIIETDISRNLRQWTRRLNYFIFAPLLSTVDEGTATTMFCLLATKEELEMGWVDNGRDTKPFLYAHCAPKAPHRCCKRSEDAIFQAEKFHEIFVDRKLL